MFTSIGQAREEGAASVYGYTGTVRANIQVELPRHPTLVISTCHSASSLVLSSAVMYHCRLPCRTGQADVARHVIDTPLRWNLRFMSYIAPDS
jgi:hypothetical protein